MPAIARRRRYPIWSDVHFLIGRKGTDKQTEAIHQECFTEVCFTGSGKNLAAAVLIFCLRFEVSVLPGSSKCHTYSDNQTAEKILTESTGVVNET